jgi:hypothetical protein
MVIRNGKGLPPQNFASDERVQMNQSIAITHQKPSPNGNAAAITTSLMIIVVAAFAATAFALAQNSDLQQRFAAVKQSVAANQRQLRQYQWLETTQLTLKGDPKPPKQSLCQYGPDGTVQKTPMGPPPEPPSGRRMKQRLIEKKTEEMQQYMGQVKTLLSMYVPPDPQKMAQAYQAGKVSLNPAGGAVNLVFRDYAQPGDQMTLSFDTAARKISSVNVSTYMDNPKDGVTLTVQMASLPDGTNYAQQTVLDATAKKIQVTTTNSNYQKRGPY